MKYFEKRERGILTVPDMERGDQQFRYGVLYRENELREWFDDAKLERDFQYAGDDPPEATDLSSKAQIADYAGKLRNWLLGPVAEKLHQHDVTLLSSGGVEQLVDAAIRLGRTERPDLRGLDKTGMVLVMNGLIEWAGQGGQDVDAFVPISQLWHGKFDSYTKAKKFLDDHDEVRTRKPSPQRLEVHAGDWFRCLAKQHGEREPTDAEIEAYLAAIEQRKADVGARRK